MAAGCRSLSTPMHVVTQNGADNSSVKTNSSGYSDISMPAMMARERWKAPKSRRKNRVFGKAPKKPSFHQTPNKDLPYYAGYDNYYSPNYDPTYHNHLLNTNPAYRQQYEERQRQMAEQHRAEKKSDAAMKEREAAMKEDWKQKGPMPPSLSKAPGQSDQGKPLPLPQPPSKSRDSPSELSSKSSMSVLKGEDSKSQQAEGLKMKLSEGSHHGKEDPKQGLESRAQPGMEQTMWYRQFPDSQKPHPEEEPPQQQQQQQPAPRWRTRGTESGTVIARLRTTGRGPRTLAVAPKRRPKRGKVTLGVSSEDHRAIGKDPRSNAHMQFSSPLAQHQGYMPYMHGYPYAQGYDPSHPGYRGMPPIMMQNYPGSYIPAGYPFSPYGGKMAGGEEGGDKSRASPTVTKSATDSKALDILHQHASQYKSKSPTVGDKAPHERGEREREPERGMGPERDADRPRSSPSQRIMPAHHHLALPPDYDLSYATGKPDRHTSTLQRFM
ncbi:hypothetical protein CRUP_034396 [Coryphaenoides rupestris]|nr:hypothetical protein CRUP_034396 [Coryphaenoides rupestris]